MTASQHPRRALCVLSARRFEGRIGDSRPSEPAPPPLLPRPASLSRPASPSRAPSSLASIAAPKGAPSTPRRATAEHLGSMPACSQACRRVRDRTAKAGPEVATRAPGLVVRRQVREDRAHRRALRERREHPKQPSAPRALQRVHVAHPAQQVRPRRSPRRAHRRGR